MSHPPTRTPPHNAVEGSVWPEVLPCGGRVIWKLEGGVWRYQTDTVTSYA